MYAGNATHYFSCGRSALAVINAAITLAKIDPPRDILDFGAGAGRVTRWLAAAFPGAAIHACDIRRQDMEFLRDHFRVDAWTIEPDVDQIDLPGQYDVIWVGSVITHLSEERTTALMGKLLAACNAGGLLIASFHGRYAVERQESGSFNYIDPGGWAEIMSGLKARGYGYADYEGNPGYGISVTDPCWVAGLAKSLGPKIVLLGERL
jgi:cyclopropane fatty-acyl-phospholipid synthase-like methyltransferase